MGNMVALLICVPIVIAILIACISNEKVSGYVVYLGAAVIAVLSIVTAVLWLENGKVMLFDLPANETVNHIVFVGEIAVMLLVIWQSFKYKKGIISVLSIVQTLMIAGVELFGPKTAETASLRMDWLAVIMILIIGIVGTLIGVYAVGYMKDYHVHHSEYKDRRRFFLSIMFVFYGAMFGLVTSMNIIWMGFFWEVTSVCSFLLIGYTQTGEAINNSFRALWMNLLGGLGIAIAIVYAVLEEGTVNLYDVIARGPDVGAAALLPIAMLAFAALTKSAQFPFAKWLLGAMVAPTPSSALLHSATMVKAGVYLLLRLSVAMQDNYVGQMVCVIGGFTFVAASLLAISQSDGKKVLAYSTISNLGLITACAGMGYKETVWAAAFLIIFHAVSKSMLFQCVGAIENTTGSRDIEDMQGLSMRFPKLAAILMIGIAGMFLAPFGMLISKWAALKAFVDASNTLMILFIAFGSATTMFYWTKWLAKILGVHTKEEKDVTHKSEYISMMIHALLVVFLCFGFPAISQHMIIPMLKDMFGASSQVLSEGNIYIMLIMIAAVFVVPLLNYCVTRNVKEKEVIAYMGGINSGNNEDFVDSFGEEKQLKVSNWYMEDWFGEKRLLRPSIWIGIVVLILYLCIVLGGVF